MSRKRLDQLVFDRKLAESREKAQRLIRAGLVRVEGQVQSKPGHLFPEETLLELTAQEPFVGRGGKKLEAAFQQFALTVSKKICLDVGASAGGFTDCLLQHGAQHVYAVDVGKGQLHWRLRNHPSVIVMEKVNARSLTPRQFDPRPSFCCIDVSFISLTKILPAVKEVLIDGSKLVTLIKPQFEAGKKHVEKGGVVCNPAVHKDVVNRIRFFGTDELGLVLKGLMLSPLKGPAGNIEYLAYWEKP
ncbi:MAG: TlyA family rRNA (cytidine-2'-O)-methyltransferase [Kiritimatiellae bacterium]|nr:TlyA family rRNA (cytidine-2'-O)-methyltransferase [Kiritimatiellia bacterium]